MPASADIGTFLAAHTGVRRSEPLRLKVDDTSISPRAPCFCKRKNVAAADAPSGEFRCRRLHKPSCGIGCCLFRNLQQEPVRRRVALKLIRPGILAITRFSVVVAIRIINSATQFTGFYPESQQHAAKFAVSSNCKHLTDDEGFRLTMPQKSATIA
jgi:hypothetical protein